MAERAWEFPEMERWNDCHGQRRVIADFMRWEAKRFSFFPIPEETLRMKLMLYFKVDPVALLAEARQGAKETES